MLQLLLKDVRITRLYLLLFFLFILVTYIFHVNNVDIFMAVMICFPLLLFYNDYHNQVNTFLISLPVKRMQIVLARYLYLIIFIIGAFICIGIIDYLAFHKLTFLGNFNFLTFNNVLVNFTITTILLAVYTPIFYFFKNFIHGITVFMLGHFFLIFMYNIMFSNDFITMDDKIMSIVQQIINIQPVAMLLIFSGLSIIFSFLFSIWFYKKRDIY